MSHRMTLSRRVLLLAAPAILLPARGEAHHGFTGRYDRSSLLALTGRVTRATFAPPHPAITLTVAEVDRPPADMRASGPGPAARRPSGPAPESHVGQSREIEFPPIRAFYDLGARVRVGDQVTVVVMRNCLAPHQLRSQWIRVASGEVVHRPGRMAGEVDACD